MATLLCLSACAGGPDGTTGYGAYPDDPARAIAAASGSQIAALSEPDPYYVLHDRGWLYGWRVCARLGEKERLGYFLLRGSRVIDQAIASERPGTQESRAQQHCSGFAAQDDARKIELGPLRIEKNEG